MGFRAGLKQLEIYGSFKIVISKDGDDTKISIANLQVSPGLRDFKVEKCWI